MHSRRDTGTWCKQVGTTGTIRTANLRQRRPAFTITRQQPAQHGCIEAGMTRSPKNFETLDPKLSTQAPTCKRGLQKLLGSRDEGLRIVKLWCLRLCPQPQPQTPRGFVPLKAPHFDRPAGPSSDGSCCRLGPRSLAKRYLDHESLEFSSSTRPTVGLRTCVHQ